MKTLEEVKTNIKEIESDDFMGSHFTNRFLKFLPLNQWEEVGYKYTGTDPFEPIEWTEENILKQLKEDVEFGIEKAEHHRGISASLMAEVVLSWCIVLENGLEDTDYGYYGDKIFKAVDKYYKFGLTKGHFKKDFYKEW